MNRYALSMKASWALKVYDVCKLFAQWLFGDCRRPSKRQRETNTSVLHHHCCWSRLQVRASTVQSLAVLSLHEWHTLYCKCTSVWSSISTLSLVCSLVLTSAESLVVRKLIGSLICYHYTTIYYSAVASNLLRLAISRAILSDQWTRKCSLLLLDNWTKWKIICLYA